MWRSWADMTAPNRPQGLCSPNRSQGPCSPKRPQGLYVQKNNRIQTTKKTILAQEEEEQEKKLDGKGLNHQKDIILNAKRLHLQVGQVIIRSLRERKNASEKDLE